MNKKQLSKVKYKTQIIIISEPNVEMIPKIMSAFLQSRMFSIQIQQKIMALQKVTEYPILPADSNLPCMQWQAEDIAYTARRIRFNRNDGQNTEHHCKCQQYADGLF